ncbi:MAG: hypothetical protein CMK09_10825 [Ponticaulis sp.]|nr:hypothetical protein [Ponticaulis sp.]
MIFRVSAKKSNSVSRQDPIVKLSSVINKAKWQDFFGLACIFLLAIRLYAVFLTPLNLGPDEAQYWRWSTAFDWGYYSKPPMIAWVIGLETSLFGHSEWAIRLFSPIFHILTGIAIFDLGRRVASPAAGVLAGLIYLTMPAVWLSSIIMSTDVQLLTFWALSLTLLFRFRETPGLITGLLLGASIGLGFLSKYAMIYFLLGMGLACIYDKPLRSALMSLSGTCTAGALLVVLAPHLIWNAVTGFKTVGHTADNANWQGSLFNLDNGLNFIGDQFGVFGPASFVLLLIVFVLLAFRMTQLVQNANIRVLLAFTLPPLVIIIVQAFISRAHANWAATASPAAAVIVAVWVCQSDWKAKAGLGLSFLINCTAGLLFVGVVSAPPAFVNDLGLANAVKRLRGWPETTDQVARIAEANNATAIIMDEREIWHGLDYYGRDGALNIPIRAWRRNEAPSSFSEEIPISEQEASNAILLSYMQGEREKFLAAFNPVEELGELRIDLGGGKYRVFQVYRVNGFSPEQTKTRP